MRTIFSMRLAHIKSKVCLTLLPLLISPITAQSVMNCSFSNEPIINFGAVDVLSGIYPSTSASVSVTCTKGLLDVGNNGYLCLDIGDGNASDLVRGSRNTFSPRLLKSGSNYAGYQIYTNAGNTDFWGTSPPNGDPNQIYFDFSGGRTVTKSISFYSKMMPISPALNGTTNLQSIIPGSYSSSFSGGHTSWDTTLLTNQTVDTSCNPRLYSRSGNFPFSVSASVAQNCSINGVIGDINFGTVASSSTNLSGNTSLSIQCTRTTPYSIGLTPSNGNTSGNGLLTKVGSPTDTVPYQLRQSAGATAPIWGNSTAIAPSLPGNGVQGVGSGVAQSYTVYATIPSASSAAGDYLDSVLVSVNY